ncbi:hypothetical protein [Fervidicoccus fontis]|uniref:hypothetical protein n=1 Tax=Fervidicoccus fontis TaxID=683846 RepID=UPI0011E5173A|nr:hypothetical protein [Fervidicoccus fontis]
MNILLKASLNILTVIGKLSSLELKFVPSIRAKSTLSMPSFSMKQRRSQWNIVEGDSILRSPL